MDDKTSQDSILPEDDRILTRPPAMGPLRLAALIEPSFSGIYLTLLSIIQSVALGFLVVELGEVLAQNPFSFERLMFIANTFLLLVLVWHSYLEGLLSLYWTPSIIDSFLPFGIGLCECLLASSSDSPSEWFGIVAIISILGCFVNVNALTKTRRAAFESGQARNHARNRSRRSIVLRLSLGAIVFPAMSWSSWRWPSLSTTFALLVLVLAAGMAAAKAIPMHWAGTKRKF